MQISRRQFVQASLAAVPLTALPLRAADAAKSVAGVQLGVQTYSFHDILNDGQNHADQIIQKMQACGLNSCELFAPQIEHSIFTGKLPAAADCPKPFLGCEAGKGGTGRNPWAWEFQRVQGDELKAARAKEKQWRETVSLDYFTAIRKKFDAAGITVYSYNPMWNMEWSDAEIDRTFQFAKALGAKAVNTSTKLTVLKRLVPFAEKNQVMVAPHGHSVTWDPEEFSTEATFEKAFALSKWVGANLDIGHYAATGANPVDFIRKHHDRITNLHVKDRQKNKSKTEEDGASVAWGKGDTPIREVLQLLKKEKYAIPAFIEYEHAGTVDPVGEVKKSVDLCKQYLA
ncbi:MAG: TIM barrel protein [Bryobacteraceae bacterium]